MTLQNSAIVRHLFPGGNTAYGFHSFYDQIIAPDATRIFIMKGGPGVGKSSFMRAIAEEMTARGHDTEYMHCSSDNNSLDGVVFPGPRVALIDGTAPHIVDPKNPGCVDEILHLGDFWDEAGMVRAKAEIMALNREVGRLFTRAYRFLRAALEIRDAWADLNAPNLDYGRLNQTAAELIRSGPGDTPIAARPGRIRTLFATALTPDGPKNHLQSIFGQAQRLLLIQGPPGSGKSTLLVKIAAQAAACGLDQERFHCSLDPHRLEHLYLPGPRIGFVTVNDYHQYDPAAAEAVLDLSSVAAAPPETASDRQLAADLIDRATECISRAKQAHDEMETYYVPHMDFAGVAALRRRTLERVLEYAGG